MAAAVANTNEMHQDASYIDPSGTGPWNQVGMMPQNIYQVLKALIKTSNEVASTRNCTQLCLLATFSPAAILMYVPVKSKLKHPPRATPGHLNFWKVIVQIPPSLGQKAVQMPPPPGKLPDYCFNFSVASIMLLIRLCMLLNMVYLATHFYILSFLNTLNTACVGLWFSTTPPRIRNLFP